MTLINEFMSGASVRLVGRILVKAGGGDFCAS